MASLLHYDGGSGFMVDSNVWIDCMDASSPWHNWAIDQLQACSDQGVLHINALIYAELLVPGSPADLIDDMLAVYETQRSALPWASAALAAQAFRLDRERGSSKTAPLPDFFIGAHAAVANLTVLTRDPTPYRSDFGRLKTLGI
jgi:predicted nucleic acid-binding protein